MSETHATSAPVFPPGRYGRRRAAGRRRPVLAALLAVAAVAVSGLVAFRLYQQYGHPDYDAEVITYTGITDSRIRIDFRVTVPAGGAAVCTVRARARDGGVVGLAEVPVAAAPGARKVATRYELATTARPFIGEVLRCRAA
ncbi:DUF4307 domain-containing protein [Micromonospora echinofusca]|uniref:DUF4307 domain-containing protein n=1 Tax=Micromonospora echinofusca TaxID=47858 RepID=A0ABS3VP94_MICEH|nr:DUF4307 domain-containing protein [Micromonospora echinofusca]MBO4206194.1 DUF4307 domain-containing protein [Micromonospora echinofusca]